MKYLFTLIVILFSTISVFASPSPTFEEVGGNQPHCPGDRVTYTLHSNSSICDKLDFNVTGGTIVSVANTPRSTSVSNHEVLLRWDGLPGHIQYVQNPTVTIDWSSQLVVPAYIDVTGYYYDHDCDPAKNYCPNTSGDAPRLYVALGIYDPQPLQSPFLNCAGSSTTLTLYKQQPAIAYYTWTSNTPGLSFSSTQQTTTTEPQVAVNTSPSLAPGIYQVNVEATPANGSCPTKRASQVFISVHNAPPSPAPTEVRINYDGNLCHPTYDAVIFAVPGADRYFAASSDGSAVNGVYEPSNNTVTFDLNIQGPQYGLTVQVTATNGCGSTSYTSPPTNLAGADPSCGPGQNTTRIASPTPTPITVQTLKDLPADVYPNPTSGKIILQSNGQEAQVILYDMAGRKVWQSMLPAGNNHTEAIISSLQAGIYHLQMVQSGRIVLSKQITIVR